MSRETFHLDREIDAAKLLRAGLGDLIEGDETLAADMVLAETSLNECIQAAAELYCRDRTATEAIKAHREMLESRQARIEKRMELTRNLVGVAMELAGRKSIDTPLGTATLKNMPRKLVTDPERENAIPSKFWKRGDPKLDRKKLKAALEAGEQIEGAQLDNASQVVAFHFR